MQKEIEAKFLNVDFANVRMRLKKAGAKCLAPMRTMRRAIFDYPDRRLQSKNGGWIRLRDEGDKITLTYKQVKELSAAGVHEVELIVNSYNHTLLWLETIGLLKQSEQITKRETWQLNDCEVVLDEWPWLKPYIEVEGPSEASIKKAAKTLGFNWSDALFGDVVVAYRAEYPGIGKNETIGIIPEVNFDLPLPDWLKQRA